MTEYFKEKKSDLVVQYLGTAIYYTVDEWENNAGEIKTKDICARCMDTTTHELIVIPFLTLLNRFEPFDRPVTDVISVLDNILNAEDERH